MFYALRNSYSYEMLSCPFCWWEATQVSIVQQFRLSCANMTGYHMNFVWHGHEYMHMLENVEYPYLLSGTGMNDNVDDAENSVTLLYQI